MNFSDYLNLYINYLENRNSSKNTINQYEKEIQYFFDFVKSKNINKIRDIEMIHIDLYFNHLTEKGNASTTRAKKASVIRSFFKYLKSRKYIEYSPAESLERIKIKDVDQKKREILTVEESMKFIDSVTKNSVNKEKNKCIILVFLFCGLRVSELVNLKTENINFKSKTLYVPGKGGKIREVPLFDELIKELKLYLKTRKVKTEYLFNRKTSPEKMSERSVHALIKRHIGKAKINKNIGCHSLRRTSASTLLKSGVNLRHIQVFLGHSDISTTMRYLNPDIDEINEDIRSKNLFSKKIKKRNSKK